MIYIVVNRRDPEEYYVLDICTSKDAALRLREECINNHVTSGFCDRERAEDIIIIQEIPLDKEVVWSYDAQVF